MTFIRPSVPTLRRPTLRPRARRAFTLAELLVVISLFLILMAVAVPAFSSMLRSSEEALADSQLRTGLAAGRDAAIRSDSGDGAAVFFYEPNGRTRIVACVQVGTLTDVRNGKSVTSTNPADYITRDIFAPLPLVQPIELPKGWMVRGLVTPGHMQATAADPTTPGDTTTGWYEPVTGTAQGNRVFEDPAQKSNWVFPENGFYDFNRADSGRNRQTFMVRFVRGTGVMAQADPKPVVVLDPIPAYKFHEQQSPWKDFRIDKATDLSKYTKQILAARSDLGAAADATRRQLIGDISTDTVLAGPVTTVALYQEKKLAQALGAKGLNKATGSLYGGRELSKGDVIPKSPTYDNTLFVGDAGGLKGDQLAKAINDWMQGRQTTQLKAKSEARLYTISRYLGQAREITP